MVLGNGYNDADVHTDWINGSGNKGTLFFEIIK
jgi:hypothetical protein